MNIKIKKKEVAYLWIQVMLLLIFVFAFICVKDNESACTRWFTALSIASFINMVILVYINIRRGFKVISPLNLFVVFSFLYNCGQVWLISMNIELTRNSFTIDRYSNATIITTLLIFQMFIILLNIGSSKVYTNKKTNKRSILQNRTSKRSLFKVGVIIFGVTASILLYND